ncbi:unnamed protein product [Rangifer tarandus platyrhynchus]|uniref:Uncharacterized protein n=1 Tax=Rangifer tarandus platyrhynchus TaxID=3082113 RepID=A0AC59YK83_RANTA
MATGLVRRGQREAAGRQSWWNTRAAAPLVVVPGLSPQKLSCCGVKARELRLEGSQMQTQPWWCVGVWDL